MQRAGIKGSAEANKMKISKLKDSLYTLKATDRPRRLKMVSNG